MTIPSTTNRWQYDGNGVTTSFAYTSKIFSSSDLVVIKTSAAGVDTTLVLNTDYTLTGVGSGSGGSITYPVSGTPLATGETITLRRVVGLTQNSSFKNQGAFYPENHEDAFDRAMMISQQQQEEIDRSFKSPTSYDSSFNPEVLPVAGAAFRFTSNGLGLETFTPTFSDVTGPTHSYFMEYADGGSGSGLTGSDLDTVLGTSLSAGDIIRTDHFDSGLTLNSGSLFQYTGTTTLAKAGGGPNADGYFYDAVGKQFKPVGNVINILAYGAGAGDADDAAAIQAAIDYLNGIGGGTIYFPAATYNIQTALVWKSNVHYRGDGKASKLYVNGTPGPTHIFNQASSNVDNVTFDGLCFDGSINYPANSQTYKQTYANKNTAIRTGGVIASNVVIKNCIFLSMSNYSIDINGDSTYNVTVRNNYFYKGSYAGACINFRASVVSYSDRPYNILITENIIEICGPQYYYDPQYEDWVASADGISVDDCRDVVISNNIVDRTGSTGIRVEGTLRASVTGNKVIDAGSNGISFYNSSFDCSCTGNTIQGWGRIPPAYAMRNYSGTYVVAREFPDSSDAPLPADPTASSWFDTWPYNNDNVNTANIITYSNTDYYTGPSTGILPFRGFAAIGVFSASQEISVTGNTCVGDVTQDGSSDYYYASEFGISFVPSANSPSSGANAGDNCLVVGNNIKDARVYRIYHPNKVDPINDNGSLLGGAYAANRDSSSSIGNINSRVSEDGVISFMPTQVPSTDPNTLDDYEEGSYSATLSPSGSGSITVNSSYDSLSYTKVGNKVTIQGRLRDVTVSSPVGTYISLNIPFTTLDGPELAGNAGCGGCITDLGGTYAVQPVIWQESALTVRIYMDASTVSTNDDFYFSFTYLASS